ncbi:hypothetical protein DFH11DRAFT_1558340 [Phellopilus nigrolimitatus]|nr:hypothetical protein DFH11DRAFT_1558340 [Phellopilus nigrolimitatus]
MTKDPANFARQGAFIASRMNLVQQSEASSPSMSSTRSILLRTYTRTQCLALAPLWARVLLTLVGAT